MSTPTKITLNSATFEVYPKGYLKITISDYSEVNLEEAKKHERACLTLCDDTPMPFLIQTRSKLLDYTEEARIYLAKNNNLDKIRLAEAFITEDVGVIMLINSYIKMNPHKCPMKSFKNEADALEWIDQFIK